MANDHKFLRMLMDRILESHQIPKVQVERVVSPVLSLFIADVLTKTFENHEALRGKYELVCMEFPLKKPENSQSTNIDFLLVNQTTSSTVFLEIKTDSESLDRIQLEIYTKLKEEVKEFGGGFLLRNLNEIANHSARGSKYSFLQKMIEPHKKTIVGSSDLQIIYLVPHDLKLKLIAENRIDAVLAFTDLPAQIDGELKEEWSIIRESLVKMERMEIVADVDSTSETVSSFLQNSNTPFAIPRQQNEKMDVRIRKQIEIFCQRNMPPGTVPKYVQIGNTGEGGSPNYQVVFSNNQIVPFHNSGKVFTRATSFKTANLKPLVLWDKFGV